MSQRKSRHWFLAILLSVLPAAAFWFWRSSPIGETRDAPLLPAGHRRMLALLQQIADRTPDEHPFYGTLRARQLRQRLEKIGESADARTRWQLHFEMGDAELRLGNLPPAIEQLTKAHQLAGSLPLDAGAGDPTALTLGIAYMRLGETQNCMARHTSDSCIMPIRGGGLHTNKEGSSKAVQHFREVLRNRQPSEQPYLIAQWLLNIAYMTIGGYPQDVPREYLVPPKAFEPEMPFPRFSNISQVAGLDISNLAGGAIADDFDNDGHLDIVTSTMDTRGQLRFFRNDRDGTFSERTKEAGLTGLYGGLNIVQADYDNDGNLDILVLRGAWLRDAGQHPKSLLRNHGDGTFTDVTFDSGLGKVHYPTQAAAWADYDNDGDLDLFIGNESSPELTAPCQLFRNDGNGTFTDVAARAGVQCLGYFKGVAWGDFDNDRFPDLYVSNYAGLNHLYRNDGDGTFTDVAQRLGVTRPWVSFPTWFWDFDNDGALDLFVASYTGRVWHVAAHYLGRHTDHELSRLYRGDGRGGFQDVTTEQGLALPILAMGCNFGDLDNDGYLDFYLGTGDPDLASLMPNLMFRNRGGTGFANVTMAGGFGHLQKGHGVAFADLDNDGDSDVFQQMGGAYRGDEAVNALYENPGFGTHWIRVKLVGVQSNRAAIGARIHVEVVDEGGERRSIYRHVTSGSSFGANPLAQTVGLGKARAISLLEVFWPTTGRTQEFHDVPFDQGIEIVENRGYTPLKPSKLRSRTRPGISNSAQLEGKVGLPRPGGHSGHARVR